MELNTLINVLNKKQNGSYIRILYTSDVPSTVSSTTIEKAVSTTIRKGIKYTNIKTVQKKLSETDNAQDYGNITKRGELAWGNWIPNYEGLIIGHTPKSTGQFTTYLRVYTSPNKPKTRFYLNHDYTRGYTAAQIQNMGIVRPSYWTKATPSDVMNIKTDNIVKIY